MKLCKDCKFHGLTREGKSFCERKIDYIDRVDGEEYYAACSSERREVFFLAWLLGDCGKKARFFEPK